MPDPSPAEKGSPIEIITDEDWKSRVKAEDAKLDAEAVAPAPATASDDDAIDEPMELPAANFLTLLQMLSTQAILALGLIPGPDGTLRTELTVARHFIDLLGVLESKCKGNLSELESSVLEQTLHDLRMGYVEATRRANA